MSVTIADLFSIPDIQPEDLLHILDASNSNEDDKVNIGALTTYLNTALDIPQTIASVNGLQAALDGKSDKGHLHTIQQIIGLSSALDDKTDVSQAQIIGRDIILNGRSINVPSAIAGTVDSRIPNTVVVGDYLQFDTTDGGIAAITGTALKNDLQIDAVDNTSDANKPVSTAQRAALDLKVDTSVYNTKQASQDTGITENTAGIQTNAGAIFLNTQKVSFDSASSIKLAGIESGADVTDTGNVWSSLGISGNGGTNQFLTQRGVFVTPTSTAVTKPQIDSAIGASAGGNTTLFYNQAGAFTAPEGGDEVTKQAIDNAIGVFPTGNSAQFYNEQGNFIDAVYDSVEDAPIIRTRTIEDILINGTRSNVQVRESGDSETSTITMQNTFNPLPTQYTSIFTSPNTSFTPALVLPTGSQGRQLSLTEADGTVHRFAYTTNGNYRLLAGGLTGTVRLGPVAVATTATVTAAVSVPDQGTNQTLTLAGDQTGVFSVGDFISPLNINFGAYRGVFIESVTLNGGNTDLVGTSNGAATFNTTSTLYLAGPADTIQGTIPTFSYDPDTADAVYTAAVVAQGFTGTGVGIVGHITQIANAIVGLDAAITWDGVITSDGTSTNVTSNSIGFRDTLNVGINQWSIITNVSGFPGVVPTIGDAWSTINGHFITESSFTTNRLFDAVAVGDTVRFTWGDGSASFPVTSKGSRSTLLGDAFNVVGTIDRTFTDAEAFTLEAEVIVSTTSSITIDLGTETNISSSFTISGGENNMNTLVNTDGAIGPLSPATTITVIDPEATEVTSFTSFVSDANDNDVDSIGQQIADAVNANIETPIDFTATYDNNTITLTATAAGNTNPWTIVINNNGATTENAGNLSTTSSQTGEVINQIQTLSVIEPLLVSDGIASFFSPDSHIDIAPNSFELEVADTSFMSITSTPDSNFFTVNLRREDMNFAIRGITNDAYNFDAGTDTTTINSDTINFVGNTITGLPTGADGLSVTDTVNLNLLQGTTVISTVMLPSAGGTTVVQGTTDEIDVTTVGDTNTISLATAITGAITANTAKNTYPAADATKLATISTNADVTLDSISAGNNITISSGGVIASTASGTADSVVRQPAGSTIAPIKFWTGTQAQYNALTPVNDVLYNITDTADVTLVSSVVGTLNEVDVITVDGQATVSLDSVITGAITANTSKLSGIEAGADVTDTTNVVGSLTAGTNITIATDGTISATSGGTTTTVQGTTNQIDVNTIGSTATVSLDTAITSAITTNTAKTGITTIQSGEITANTAKIGLESLNQVGGAIIGSDSIAYLDNTTPRRKTFNLVPLSIFNNDAGFTTNAGTVTSINGTTDEVDVTSGATPTVSLSSTITDAIDANTSKTGISTAQANAITANTAKVGITTAQSSAITTNTAKVGITTAQASAITANTAKTGITSAQASAITNNTAKVGITTAQTTKLAGLSADSVDRQTAGSTTAPIKFWTGTQNQYNALTPVSDVLYNITDTTFTSIVSSVLGTADEIDVNISGTTAILSLDNTVTSAINANTDKVGITTAQATAITTNTAKTGITTTQANNIVTNNAKVSVSGLNQVGGAIIASDSILYYDNTTPRRKTFSLVPLSVFNNDAGFTTSSGTVTSVSGTNNQVNVASGTTTPVISLDSSITSAITANTAKTGISTAQASAIIANTAKNSYPSADATKLATLSADSIDRQANGSTTDPVKFWTGTNAQYNALTPVGDVFYNITDTPESSALSSVIGTNNQVDVSTVDGTATVSLNNTITSAIAANTLKVTYPGSAAVKLGGIEDNADVTDKSNVDSSIGSGSNTTDYYASDKTWKTIPSAGASLTANQTFTGLNRFTQGIARETGGSTTNGIKFWSGTEAQYNTLGTGRDQNTVYYLTDI